MISIHFALLSTTAAESLNATVSSVSPPAAQPAALFRLRLGLRCGVGFDRDNLQEAGDSTQPATGRSALVEVAARLEHRVVALHLSGAHLAVLPDMGL